MMLISTLPVHKRGVHERQYKDVEGSKDMLVQILENRGTK